ncbi:MAG: chain length-determining protein [Methyloversatilis sp.]|nr:chain length-determining protein [Methyloversatilis sp.]
MDELLRLVLSYLRSMWSYRWAGLIVAWVIGLVGAVVVMKLPDKYEASAKIYVDTQSLLRPLMSGLAIQPNIDQQINMLSRTLITRPNVEKLIRMSDMDIDVKTKKERDELIDTLIKDLKLSSSGRDNLYNVTYSNQRPEKAQKVVQSLVTLFVESGLGGKRQDADTARKFIEEQIKSYEAKLLEAENRVKEFRLKNLDRPGGNDYFGSLSAAQGQLKEAQLALSEATNSRDALRRQIVGEEPTLAFDFGATGQSSGEPGGAGPNTSELDQRIAAMTNDVEALLQRYTDAHPDVATLRSRISKAEAERAEKVAQFNAALAEQAKKAKSSGVQPAVNPLASMSNNPVYQQLKVALAESEAQVASLTARVAEYSSRVAKMKDSARLVPELEAEFAQLNRDYDIQKDNYNQLVSRRESASISEEMDASGVAEFRLIEPPRVTPNAVSPNRLILLPAVLGGAFGVAIAICFLLSQLRPVFHDGRDLAEATGVPVLGSVSMLLSDDFKRVERRRQFTFLGGVGSLIASYVALLAFVALAVRSA